MTEDTVFTSTEWVNQIPVVHLHGVLDARSYMQVRNTIVKAATDSPDAVLVVVDDLSVPTESAWTVLTSSSWLIRQWPGIPLSVVSNSSDRRERLTRNGIARYLPIHPGVEDALAEIRAGRNSSPVRVRVRHHRPRTEAGLAEMRELVTDTLRDWGHPECVPAARCISSVLSGNVLRHTDSDLDMRVEMRGDLVTIAMQDGSPAPAVLREESADPGTYVSGLAILAALSQAWGSVPSEDGKTVWSVMGPENYLPMYR
ncbi:ATP-binding protein [Rhodococcoides yunnanense]|uniref:ATP-binding protein n=1 Tax=Rhodococcoides yunnanense TaxID=278209 RepID=UPI000932C4D2|nr:ATP-binding protein [Rhodococcus yunnanensis]